MEDLSKFNPDDLGDDISNLMSELSHEMDEKLPTAKLETYRDAYLSSLVERNTSIEDFIKSSKTYEETEETGLREQLVHSYFLYYIDTIMTSQISSDKRLDYTLELFLKTDESQTTLNHITDGVEYQFTEDELRDVLGTILSNENPTEARANIEDLYVESFYEKVAVFLTKDL